MTCTIEFKRSRCKHCNRKLNEIQETYCSRKCSAIYRSRKLGGLFGAGVSDSVIKKAVCLVNKGMPWKHAAHSIGISQSSFRDRAQTMEIKIRPGHFGKRILLSRIDLPKEQPDLAYLAALLDSEGY